MIAYLEGRLLATTEHSCMLLTDGGVGYEVHLSGPMLSALPAKGEPVCMFTSTIVREDALELYGFESFDERETFEVLLTISKLGPKTSLAVLAVFSPEDLRRVVLGEDPDALTSVPGIGKKTAQHIFLELKYKLKVDRGAAAAPAGPGQGSTFRDALAGLMNLGYAEAEARAALETIFADEPDLDVAGALRAALKAMARKT
jgi:Holliday junction DNA helicase RuvA